MTTSTRTKKIAIVSIIAATCAAACYMCSRFIQMISRRRTPVFCFGDYGDNSRLDFDEDLFAEEPSSAKRLLNMKPAIQNATNLEDAEEDCATDVLQDLFAEAKDACLSNESIAKVIVELIKFQNLIEPERAIDVRRIHFVNHSTQRNMIVEFYTVNCGKEGFEEELKELWRNVFMADGFWNADFTRIRINVHDSKSANMLETISCDLEAVRRYLLREIDENEFYGCWTRKQSHNKKAATGKNQKKMKLKTG